jgi:hypothetical protein
MVNADGTVICGTGGTDFEGVRSFGEACAEHERPWEVETGTPTSEGVSLFPCATVGPELDGGGVGTGSEEDAGGGPGERD